MSSAIAHAGHSLPADIERELRREAADLERLDRAVYRQFGRDTDEPVVGLGPPDAAIAIFGRDPGRKEIEIGRPFVGAGGQKVREALHRHRYGGPLPDFETSLAVGDACFWINTVPYKPEGNKAWSMAVKKRFQPLMARLLTECWRGDQVVTLGREAFFWFGIGQSREVRADLERFWAGETTFESTHRTTLTLPDGKTRDFTLAPLPHPSPLNQRWFKRFPELLDRRLEQLGV